MPLLILALLLMPFAAHAADAVTATQLLPPDAVVNILAVLQGLPYVGPVLVYILKAIAVIAPVMTALSVAVQAILIIPEVAARFSGAPALADKVKYWSDKITYWLGYLSIRNVKK